MKTMNLGALLSENTYPGRGIVVGLTPDGKRLAIGYFIMGRSVNSRNRVFVSQPDGGIITKAFDESKMVDPSLIIYAPVRVPEKGLWIVTNGDQTDTVRDFLADGKTFEDALRAGRPQLDAPHQRPGGRARRQGRLSHGHPEERRRQRRQRPARFLGIPAAGGGGGAFPAHLPLRRQSDPVL